MTLEIDIQNAIRAELGHGDTRLFRQHVGEFWTGKATRTRTGAILIENPRRVPVGFEGQPDLGGWTVVTITDAMVGQRIAVAVQVEVKRSKGANRRAKQKEFIAFAVSQGVRAGFAASVDEAKNIVAGR